LARQEKYVALPKSTSDWPKSTTIERAEKLKKKDLRHGTGIAQQ